ncbi:MAG: sigma factor [Ktedonobacteraceae bacterium]
MTREQTTLSLLNHVTPMLWKWARSTGYEFDDLYQDASLVVLKVIDHYQQKTINDLKRLVTRSVRNRIIDTIRYQQNRRHVSLDEQVSDEGEITRADLVADLRQLDPLTNLIMKERIDELAPIAAQITNGNRARKIRELRDTALASTEECRECAWCLHEQGITPTTGSHGICQKHADQMRAQSQARKKERAKA